MKTKKLPGNLACALWKGSIDTFQRRESADSYEMTYWTLCCITSHRQFRAISHALLLVVRFSRINPWNAAYPHIKVTLRLAMLTSLCPFTISSCCVVFFGAVISTIPPPLLATPIHSNAVTSARTVEPFLLCIRSSLGHFLSLSMTSCCFSRVSGCFPSIIALLAALNAIGC